MWKPSAMTEHQVEFCSLLNGLRLTFYEAWTVNFQCAGENVYSFNRLFYVASVEGAKSVLRCASSGKRFEMQAGFFYFVAAGTKLEFNFRKGTRFLSFHFNLNFFEHLDIFFGSGLFREMEGTEESLRELYAILEGGTPLQPAQFAAFYSIFFRTILPLMPGASLLKNMKNREKYAEVLKRMGQADAQVSLAELSEIAGVSQDTLSRNFSRDFGIPLKRCLAIHLISRAEQLLRDPHLQIQEIAKILKFNDVYYFSKFFRKETGVAPSRYRHHG